MKRAVLILTILPAVSALALFFMKAVLWALLRWGGEFAVPLAFFLGAIYIWSYKITKSLCGAALPNTALIWIWALGFIQLLILGGLYHLAPRFFPSIAADFFFE